MLVKLCVKLWTGFNCL